MNESVERTKSRIAVVGTASLFPESIDDRDFWRNILLGKDLITDVPPTHWLAEDYYDTDTGKPGKVCAKRGAFLPEVDFDPMEFGIPPKLLASIDTVQLLALFTAKKLLERVSSFQRGLVDRKNTSVILGVGGGTELVEEMSAKIQRPVWVKAMREQGLPESQVQAVCDRIYESYAPWDENTFPGLLTNVVAGRIANRLDLGGTNCTVDAACGSSLAAVAMAMKELQSGAADLVITGGCDALNSIFMFMCFSQSLALSRSGECRPFSDKADGTLLGEGIGMVALRRIEDAQRDDDAIHALINAMGTSSDGNAKSIYAPLPEGQALAIRRAYDGLDYTPADIELIEAHGTGTAAGDMAEFQGLRTAFRDAGVSKNQYCALGSVKSQIGHTKSAAGIAGLLKAVFSLRHKVLPPTIKIDTPNPALNIEQSPFYLNRKARPWIHAPRSSRKAGVSSFGFGGSNFHLAVEEYQPTEKRPLRYHFSPKELILIYSDDRTGLADRLHALIGDLAKVSFEVLARSTQESFRVQASLRLALVVEDAAQCETLARTCLQRINSEPEKGFSLPEQAYFESGPRKGKLAFLFAGQGSQYLEMTDDLSMEFDACREVWDFIAGSELQPLHEVVFPVPCFRAEDRAKQEAVLADTQWTQPALGAASLAHLALLAMAGLEPDCVAGHSYGEIPALYAAGVIPSREDLLRISWKRGTLMSSAADLSGAMTAVMHPIVEIERLLGNGDRGVTMANINSPNQVVLSGPRNCIEAVEQKLARRNIAFQRLSVSTAFHSAAVGPSVEPFEQYLAGVNLGTPDIPVYGNTSGTPYPDDVERVRSILANQLARPVLFKNQIEAMYKDRNIRVFLELGPGTVLSRLVGECLAGQAHTALSLDPGCGGNGLTAFWTALGRLSVAGIPVDYAALWKDFARPEKRRRRSKSTIRICGSNYGKRYPPEQGTAGIPRPNPELPAPKPEQMVHASQDFMTTPENNPPLPSSGLLLNNRRMEVLSAMHRETLDAQRAFQDTLKESHMAFLRTAEATMRQLLGTSPPDAFEPPAAETTRSRHVQAAEVDPPTVPAAHPDPSIPAADEPQAERKRAASTTRPGPEIVKETVLQVVSEKTGYPEEMIDPDADLESVLGIDSIKRVEILSTLQERLPELKKIDTAALTRLNTLRAIAEMLGGPAATEPLPGGEASARSGTMKTEPAIIQRYVVKRRPSPAAGATLPGLRKVLPIYLVKDNRGVAGALAQKLTAEGIRSKVVDAIPEKARSVLFLKGLDTAGGDPCAGALESCMQAFKTARSVGQELFTHKGVFIVVGDSGPDTPSADNNRPLAWAAGLSALAKTAAREWPRASVKCIDVACTNHGPDDVARTILDELLRGGPEIEVGLSTNGKRWIRTAVPSAASKGSRPLGENDVVVASGGARGVTAACLKALADRSKVRIAVLGRTLLDEAPQWVADCSTESELKRALYAQCRSEGTELTPAEIHRQVRAILATREVRSNITELASCAAGVKYYPVDIRNTEDVANTLRQVRHEWGRIRAVIHGAGVLADKHIHEKTDKQFLRVFETKVTGLWNLLRATEEDDLTHLCCFSSVAAFAGNPGQVDYAMANELVNAICRTERVRRKERCRVKSINWGPWDGGMVKPELKAHFASQGVGLIPLDEGAAAFVRELEDTGEEAVEVIIGGMGMEGFGTLRAN
jgi:acyl transferase domain-containing protein/NAD(P)-dependent dehydrogenase (short-subunit alcohol dehydrogenase family)